MHHASKSNMKFTMHEDGLHYFDTNHHEVSFIETVEENKKGYSHCQLHDAKLAHEVYAKVGHPSIADFKAMVKGKMLSYCPITVEDVA